MAKLKKGAVRLHHIGSHFTNALFPSSALFLTLFLFGYHRSFEQAAFYSMVLGTLATPFVYLSGVYDWKTRFEGRHTRIFTHKIFFGALFLLVSLLLVALRITQLDDIVKPGFIQYLYAGLLYTATLLATYLGYLGGKFL